jgi:hypothetical protein
MDIWNLLDGFGRVVISTPADPIAFVKNESVELLFPLSDIPEFLDE